MILSALPVPPMPIIVVQEVPDEITFMSGEHKMASSHDLWAMLLLSAMSRNDQEENKKRALLQKQITENLFQSVRKLEQQKADLSVNVSIWEERVYDVFATFTRENIEALSKSADLRIPPLCSVEREDRIHIASCHHAAAQDILFGPLQTDASRDKRTAQMFSENSYSAILMRQWVRIRDAEQDD
jgi:hypothetical protein